MPFTTSHLLTHLPLAVAPTVPDSLSVYSTEPPELLAQQILTNRPPPLLPVNAPLRFRAVMTRQDAARQPTGAAFLAALTIRGLARSLRSELDAARPGEMGLTDAQRREKKKHLAQERFGLPIPTSVLREEEEEEDEARGIAEAGMGDADRDRARDAFRTVEERVLEVVNTNFAGLGGYLGDAFGW
jgi:chromatin structure-remodeling complex subunit RSC9